jgi:signal transduction histidine kinase
VNWSDAARLIHGWHSPDVPTLWQALEFIEPHDRADVFAKGLRCVELGQAFEAEVDLRAASGERKRVVVSGHAVADEEGCNAIHGTVRVVPGGQPGASSTSVAELLRIVDTWEMLGSAIPHELRSPLTTITGFAQAMARTEHAMSAPSRQRLGRILAAARHMEGLLDGLVRFADISSAPVRREAVNISALATECIHLVRDSEPHRQVDVAIDAGISVAGDPDLLRLVMGNLLANAWKFTRDAPEPRIEVGTERIAGREVVAVRDNGVGFEMSDAARVFVPFQRLHSGQQFAGAGLGLAIVRHAVERHGGNVWARSLPGRGATFYFQVE